MKRDPSGQITIQPKTARGSGFAVALPPDKSLTHRALFFAAMPEGESVLVSPSVAYDCMSTRTILESFGVHVDEGASGGKLIWRVRSPGIDAWVSPDHVIDAGNSGTTARMIMGLGAGVEGLRFELKGDDSLMRRPMGRIVDPLRVIGAEITGRDSGLYLPMSIRGQRLQAFKSRSDIVSAQVKSALLFAATRAMGVCEIDVPAGTRDHTERMLKAMGAPLTSRVDKGREVFTLKGPWKPDPFRVTVPRDPSAMTFFAVLAFITPGLTVRCEGVLDNPGRARYLTLLERAGLTVTRTARPKSEFPGEHTADFEFVRTGPAGPIHFEGEDVAEVIDEVPALAVAAVVCSGESYFQGLDELRVKESDRLSEIARLLKEAGVKPTIEGNNLRIPPVTAVKGFQYSSDDHRMIMAASILATIAEEACIIGPEDAASVSFPLFFDQLQQLYR